MVTRDVQAAAAGMPSGGPVVALDCGLLLGPTGPLAVSGVVHASFGAVTAGFLATVQPSVVIVPLFAAGYDAATAVAQLEALSYLGRIAVIAPVMPDPRLVEAELRDLGPGARLVLIAPETLTRTL